MREILSLPQLLAYSMPWTMVSLWRTQVVWCPRVPTMEAPEIAVKIQYRQATLHLMIAKSTITISEWPLQDSTPQMRRLGGDTINLAPITFSIPRVILMMRSVCCLIPTGYSGSDSLVLPRNATNQHTTTTANAGSSNDLCHNIII